MSSGPLFLPPPQPFEVVGARPATKRSRRDAVLYLDVDGPLNPYGAKPEKRPPGYETHRMRPSGWERTRNPLRVWLNPDHGPALLHLARDADLQLVWASTWAAEANTWISPVLGLPDLPWVDPTEWQGRPPEDGTMIKTPGVVAHAAGRPFAWVDDLLTTADDRYVARHHPAPALLLRIDPAVGLLDGDLERIAAWAGEEAI